MAGTAIGRGVAVARVKRLTSSGRQMVTSEHRGHLGLSSSGGGMAPPAARLRSPSTALCVRATSSSSKGTRTRSRLPTKYSTPSTQS